MNILFVTPYLPYPPLSGGSLQTFLRLINLRRRGHSVFLFSLATERDRLRERELGGMIDGLQCLYVRPDATKVRYLFRRSLLYEIYTLDRSAAKRLTELTKAHPIDVALLEGLAVAHYRDRLSGVPAVLYEHNVEEEIVEHLVQSLKRAPGKILRGSLGERMTNLYLYLFGCREQRLVRELEAHSLRRFELCLCCSPRDAVLLEKHAGKDCCAVVPWCVDEPSCCHEPVQKGVCTLSFLGSMRWEPNRDAIQWFAREVFPLIKTVKKNIILSIAGSSMTEEVKGLDNRTDIFVRGFVPEVSDFLSVQTDIFVAPIRLGSGVNVKIIEAMSYGLPVVTTPKGAEGLQVTNGEHLLVCDTPDEFVKSIVLLADDLQLRISLGGKAKEYVAKHHGIDGVMASLERHLRKTAEDGRRERDESAS